MKAVGLDIGTTTISAVVMDLESGTVLETRTIPNACDLPSACDWEHKQDAERIVSKAKAAVDDLLEKHPETVRIGLTGQMHGMVYINAGGKNVSPLYTWQDQGAVQSLKALSESGYGSGNVSEERSAAALLRERGLKANAGFGTATHFMHQLTETVPPDAVSFATIPDYLGMTLTGRTRPLQHVSMAASMGCFDIRTKQFCVKELAGFGMDISMLPEVTDRFVSLGTYRGRSVTVAIGDNQASFLGSAALESNTVLLNMGTGGQISVLVEEPVEGDNIESRPITHDRYIAVGSSLSGGRAYAALEKFFRAYLGEAMKREEGSEGKIPGAQYDCMAALLEKEKPFADPLQVVTAFNGSRFDPGLRGSISNISEENFTPGNLIYGVLWGICGELRGMFGEVEEKTGLKIRRLVGSGNGIRKNKALQEIARLQFGVELELSPYEEEAACGAARVHE